MFESIKKAYIRRKEDRLWQFCSREFRKELGVEHGLPHWKRVAAFGEYLCSRDPDVDRMVVRAFACLHDVRRKDNLDDTEHGKRASDLVFRLRRTLLSYLSDSQIATLAEACAIHTNEKFSLDRTVNACLDADRMDLPRCGIQPLPERMASRIGAETVGKPGFVEDFWKSINEDIESELSNC